jgi:hypothetical protein
MPHGHPRPSAVDALERSHVRKAADEHTQQLIWNAFYIGLGLLFAIGVTVGLLHHSHADEALPPPPPAVR